MNKTISGPSDPESTKEINYIQVISTEIGTFAVRVNLMYHLNLTFLVEQKDFRNVDLNVIFSTSLDISIRFEYGIVNTLSAGISVKGTIVKSEF